MVAMLVAIAVAAVWMSAALPSWRQQAIREKEADLVFRGEQYARAIYLYNRKNGALPQTIDQLVDGRYLRKKYLDPITGKDFVALGAPTGQPTGRQGGQRGQAPFAPAGAQAGISGVRSTSTEQSIRIYNNATVYSQWAFDWPLAMQRAGAAPTPEGGRRGQPGAAREGRGGVGTRGGPGGRGGGELAPISPRRGGAPPPPPPPPGRGGRGF
jgi:type II secretory pathway pseudopilin PulG